MLQKFPLFPSEAVHIIYGITLFEMYMHGHCVPQPESKTISHQKPNAITNWLWPVN